MASLPVSSLAFNGALREMRSALLAAAGLSLFVNLLVFVSPLYTMQLYDRVLTSRNGMTLLLLSLIALLLFVAYAALEHFRSRILVQAGLRFDGLVSGHAFESALGSALRARGAHHVQTLRDVETLRDVLSGGAMTALMDTPWIPIYLTVCLLLHPLIALVALIGSAVLLTLAFLNERATHRLLVQAATKNLRALDRLTSSLRNAEVIRGLGMASAIRSAWSRVQQEALAHSVSAGERSGTFVAASKFLRMTIQATVMAVGAHLAINQEISGGALFAAALIVGRALAPIEAVVAHWKGFVAARSAFMRLEQAFAIEHTGSSTTRLPRPNGGVSVEALTVTAPGTNVPVVIGATLEVRPGELVAIVGESGSGKSSLARALIGAWLPAQGCVRMDGNDLRHFDKDLLGCALGYLPQDVELFAGSVRNNIARFRADATDEEVVEASIHASSHSMIQRLPNGYDTQIGEDGVGLSGGQRQRVGLARALFGKPAFVVLDEPNASLDKEGDMALAQAIRRLQAQKVAVVIVTHRPGLLSVVDRIVFMQAGRIKRIGTREDVLPVLLGEHVAPGPRPVGTGDESRRAAFPLRSLGSPERLQPVGRA